MEHLFKNEVDYVGVELTPKEAIIISKVLGNIPLYQRDEILSIIEKKLRIKVCLELKA